MTLVIKDPDVTPRTTRETFWDKMESRSLSTILTFASKDKKPPVIEATSAPKKMLMPGAMGPHGLANAIIAAFSEHYPLVISPDVFWVTLTQSLANHINANAEQLRSKFVSHEGKKKITINRDSFVKGSPDNDWAGCFNEFSAEIKKHIGEKNHKLIVADFSTTTPLALAVSELVLMDAMQSYFEFGVCTACGIPEFHIEGTKEDWQRIGERVAAWAEFNVSAQWIASIQEIISQIELAFDGKEQLNFWRSIYGQFGGSGRNDMTGWINNLFLYVKDGANLVINPYIKLHSECADSPRRQGLEATDLPSSLSSVPFEWEYFGNKLDYRFIGGCIGSVQNDDLIIRPQLGWVVSPE